MLSKSPHEENTGATRCNPCTFKKTSQIFEKAFDSSEPCFYNPLHRTGRRLLLAANELVPLTDTKVDVEILEIGTEVLVLNCIESIDYLTLGACFDRV